MRLFIITSRWLVLVGLSLLSACGASEKSVTQVDTPAVKTAATSSSPAISPATHGRSHPGGTTIETQGFHLEMVPELEANRTHLDLYLQNGENHAPIPTAKVIAQIQSPDGKQQSINMKYDANDRHYTGIVPGKTPGQYQVKINADIDGKKVDGRFKFDR
jgi:hypothetical protein